MSIVAELSYAKFTFADGGGGGAPTEGLVDAEYEASIATLESVAATLNAKCVLLREKQLDESGKWILTLTSFNHKTNLIQCIRIVHKLCIENGII